MQQLMAEEDAIIDAEVGDSGEAEKEALAAASAAWVPITPQYVDTHFSLWSLSKRPGDLYEGVQLPGQKPNSWHGLEDSAVACLRRDFKPDEFEEELDEVRRRANAELNEGIGELSPIQYGIHVQATPTYHENMAISSIAEEYYFIAGYIGWADIYDPGFRDRLKTLMFDPFLVGLRHDLSRSSPDNLLLPEVDANFSAIEQQGVPFDLMIGPHQLKHACHLAYKHPKLKLILNHCGMPVEVMATQPNLSASDWRSDLEYLSRYPNVFCKLTPASGKVVANKTVEKSSSVNREGDSQTAASVTRSAVVEWKPATVISHSASCFGPDRCLFGSGWPICRVVAPSQTGWEDCGTGGFMVSSRRPKYAAIGRGATAATNQMSLWESCRLVEHCLEEVGFGAIEDKRKVFASNAQSVYTLNIRPYGSSRVL
ncbi:hypothetical protein SprV_0100286600 [Sparganum proliferum]